MHWNNDTPIYKQIVQHVRAKVVAGEWKAGDQAPSVRQLASQMMVNPLTIAKAYQECVDEGILEKRRGLGMYVTSNAQASTHEQEKRLFLTQEWPHIQERIKRLGIQPQELNINWTGE